MTAKRTWVYPKDGEPYEVGQDWTPTTGPSRVSEGETFGNLQATDGTDLSTRKRWREYQQQNGLTGASDFTNEWAAKSKERQEIKTTGGDHRERKETLGRVAYELSQRRGRR